MDYAYKYFVKGPHGARIKEWFDHQSNKRISLDLLIQQAQKKYGNADLLKLSTNAFLDDQIQVDPTQHPVTSETQYQTPSAPVESVTSNQPAPATPKPATNSVSNSAAKKKPSGGPNFNLLH